MEEVLPQPAFSDRCRWVAVTGADNAHIGPEQVGPAHALIRPGLQHAQEMHLHVGRHLGDLVQKQGAAAGIFKVARILSQRPGKTSLLMPEQFSVGKRAADGAAVHGDKRLAAPFAGVVDRARNNLFARAALSHDENAGIGGRRQVQRGGRFLRERCPAG
ncbi:hypothetical protein G6F65_020930 [Rhizopus arrhizus]|nr:hypothetical protein G6F65_020930 [Rhizopus arrhizus]